MATYTFSGTIVDTATESPDPSGLRIEAWDATGVVSDLLGYALTDVDGRFSITLDQVVQLTTTPSDPRWPVRGTPTTTRIEVDTGEPSPPGVTPRQFVVRGRVVHVDDGPVNAMSVDIYDFAADAENDSPLGDTLTTNARGWFELHYDPPTAKQLADIKIVADEEGESETVVKRDVFLPVVSRGRLRLHAATLIYEPGQHAWQDKMSFQLHSYQWNELAWGAARTSEIGRLGGGAQLHTVSLAHETDSSIVEHDAVRIVVDIYREDFGKLGPIGRFFAKVQFSACTGSMDHFVAAKDANTEFGKPRSPFVARRHPRGWLADQVQAERISLIRPAK